MLRTPLRALSGHSGVVIAADWLPGGEQVSTITISTKKFRTFTNYYFQNVVVYNLYININEFQPWRSLITHPTREVSS